MIANEVTAPFSTLDIEAINRTLTELNAALKTELDHRSIEYVDENEEDFANAIKERILALTKIVQMFYTRAVIVPVQVVGRMDE